MWLRCIYIFFPFFQRRNPEPGPGGPGIFLSLPTLPTFPTMRILQTGLAFGRQSRPDSRDPNIWAEGHERFLSPSVRWDEKKRN